ncbi:MAG: hypothetical protein MHMPM18_003792 [Marteilia pararefringens]
MSLEVYFFLLIFSFVMKLNHIASLNYGSHHSDMLKYVNDIYTDHTKDSKTNKCDSKWSKWSTCSSKCGPAQGNKYLIWTFKASWTVNDSKCSHTRNRSSANVKCYAKILRNRDTERLEQSICRFSGVKTSNVTLQEYVERSEKRAKNKSEIGKRHLSDTKTKVMWMNGFKEMIAFLMVTTFLQICMCLKIFILGRNPRIKIKN